MDRLIVKVLSYIVVTVFAAGLGKSFGDVAWKFGAPFGYQITVFCVAAFAVILTGVLMIENESKPARGLFWLVAKFINGTKLFLNGVDWLAGGAGRIFKFYPRLAMYVNGKRVCIWGSEARIPREAELKGVGVDTVNKAKLGEVVTFYSAGKVEVMPHASGFVSKFKK